MITQLGKDIFNAQYRVLDHRVFVNGEIETFVNNFETQRKDSEVESLFKVTEIVGALKYDLSDKCITLGSTNLKNISEELKDILVKVDTLVNQIQKPKEVDESLKKARLQRAQNKEDITSQFKENLQRVENSFTVKEEEVTELYSDLQLKFNIPK